MFPFTHGADARSIDLELLPVFDGYPYLGLAELRNKLGDAHGKTRVASRPQPRHARLAAGAATTVATFLVETLESRRRHSSGPT
jgi:hypothetical protein